MVSVAFYMNFCAYCLSFVFAQFTNTVFFSPIAMPSYSNLLIGLFITNHCQTKMPEQTMKNKYGIILQLYFIFNLMDFSDTLYNTYLLIYLSTYLLIYLLASLHAYLLAYLLYYTLACLLYKVFNKN